jgi:CRISPR system Cascade subunit CasE
MWALVSQYENQQRDFLYRVEYDAYQNIEHIYLLAPYRVSPKNNNVRITISPEYKPMLEKKERLYFKLRANPVVKRRENGKAREYGLVMDAKWRFRRDGRTYQEERSLDELVHEVCMKWLIKKGEQHGFSVKQFEVAIDNGRKYSIKSAGKQEYMLRTQDFSGVLTVADPELFIRALYKGIGPAKAFGCGLMLVRRI